MEIDLIGYYNTTETDLTGYFSENSHGTVAWKESKTSLETTLGF
jgi:hypothetical protein